MHDIVGTSLSQRRYSAFCSGACVRLLHFEPGCVSEMVSVPGIKKSNLHPLAFVVMCYIQYGQHIYAGCKNKGIMQLLKALQNVLETNF